MAIVAVKTRFPKSIKDIPALVGVRGKDQLIMLNTDTDGDQLVSTEEAEAIIEDFAKEPIPLPVFVALMVEEAAALWV